MSASRTAEYLLDARGAQRQLDAFVVAVAFCGDLPAFALGDGALRLGSDFTEIPLHDGAVMALAATHNGFATGGDDGRLIRIDRNGTAVEVQRFGSKWVEQVAAFGDLLACSVGKTVHLVGPAGPLKSLDHPSTVTGLAFDTKGKRICTSHYNGASQWFVAAKVDSARRFEWKGSHTGIAIHPAGDAIVTSMQENALHGWRLSDGQHMRMSGYPAKTESLSFSRNGKWLASSGADTVVLWPFFGGGPMGKPPVELAGGNNVMCTRVACHPKHEMVAAGFADGLVVLADMASNRLLPVAPPQHGPVSALAWSGDGARLAFGTETGFAALVDFSKR